MCVDMFDGMYFYIFCFIDVLGFLMYFVDEGFVDGEVVLCLYGELIWGFFFWYLIVVLCGVYCVVVFDYMGFGRSEILLFCSYWL